MDEPKNQTTTTPDAQFVGASCGACNRETRHKVLADTSTHWAYDDDQVDVWVRHQIIQCQGCLTVSFRESSKCSEEFEYDERTGGMYLPETVKLFPSRISGRAVMREAHLLPHNVYRIYQEAHAALCAELGILAGLGLRSLVEAVCVDRQVTKGNLQEKIDALATAGHITAAGAKILHSLRFMGNAAAHEVKAHTPQQLNAAFDVVEHLLQGVYVLPTQAADLPSGNRS
jgi:hypothetical protein